MRRLFPLLIALALAVVVPAQSQQTELAPQPDTSTQLPGPSNNLGIPPAPKPGHPLDPNDVAILTGKGANSSATQQPYAAPQFYYSLPAGGSMFTQNTVGGAFDSQRHFGYGYSPYGFYGGYSNFNGSQFANVTTSSFARDYYGYSGYNDSQFANVTTSTLPFVFGGNRKPGVAPNFFFGTTTPGLGFNRWSPHFWPSAKPASTTAPKSSPGLRP